MSPLNIEASSEVEISDNHFLEFISAKTASLQTMSKHIIINQNGFIGLAKPYFGRIHLEATKIEEILDAYGAKNNQAWHTFRKAVATMKLFSNVSCICLHIKYSIGTYALLKIEQDFPKATDDVLAMLYKSMICIAGEVLRCSEECGIPDYTFAEKRSCSDDLPEGRLKNNRQRRIVDEPEKNIIYLVTQFLNLSEEIKQLDIYKKVNPSDYALCIPDTVSEEKIRWIENKFHNLQSLYDTNISDSNLESVDTNLPVLRGHASIIYHLLEVATELCHYYERHMIGLLTTEDVKLKCPISQDELLSILFDYCFSFSENYLDTFHELSRDILKDYAEEGQIAVPIPNYRGFHVRPSTLISRIVFHYGSTIHMVFDCECFDASQPLEIFRINEKINSLKRKSIANRIANTDVFNKIENVTQENYRQALQTLFLGLLENNSIILYESNFSFNDISFEAGESLLELANKSIARSLALGRIDITNDMTVEFHGDTRALNDLKILAEYGYGEDNYGNNILLPKQLSYLRR